MKLNECEGGRALIGGGACSCFCVVCENKRVCVVAAVAAVVTQCRFAFPRFSAFVFHCRENLWQKYCEWFGCDAARDTGTWASVVACARVVCLVRETKNLAVFFVGFVFLSAWQVGHWTVPVLSFFFVASKFEEHQNLVFWMQKSPTSGNFRDKFSIEFQNLDGNHGIWWRFRGSFSKPCGESWQDLSECSRPCLFPGVHTHNVVNSTTALISFKGKYITVLIHLKKS